MAALLVGQVLERWPGFESLQMLIAVILADAADPDGSNVYPSIGRIAKLARCSHRSVQYALRDFVEIGFLVLEHPGGGRGRPAKYRIVRRWLESQVSALLPEQELGARTALFYETVQTDSESSQKQCKNPAATTHKPLHPTQQPRPLTRKAVAAHQDYELTLEGIVFVPGNALDELGLQEIRQLDSLYRGAIVTAINEVIGQGKRPFTSVVLSLVRKYAKQCVDLHLEQQKAESERLRHQRDLADKPYTKIAGDLILAKTAAKYAANKKGESIDA